MSEPPPAPAGFRVNRHLAAVILMCLFETLPAAALYTAIQSGRSGWIVLAVLFTALAALPGVGIWWGKTWGFILGAYVSGLGLAGIILRGLSGGFTTTEFALGSVYGVLFFAMHWINPLKEKKPEEKKPDSLAQWIKENLEAIVMAFIMALIIRCFCIEVFKIPSSSMEPTLMGDRKNSGGDRIMVLKPAFAISPVERFDVIVFKFPLQQTRNFIKRVVGLPGEELRVYEGNLFVKRPGDDAFHIARKKLDIQSSIWIEEPSPDDGGGIFIDKDNFTDFWTARLVNGGTGASYDVGAGRLTTLESNGSKDSRFVLKRSLTDGNADGSRNVEDARIVFDFEITSAPGEIFAEIVNAYGKFRVCLSTEGPGTLYHHAPGSERRRHTSEIRLRDARIGLDRRTRLELAVFDGTAYALLDGTVRASIDFIDTFSKLPSSINSNPERNIAFGSNGLTFTAWDLHVGRDIRYRCVSHKHTFDEKEPVKIPKDTYMVMGDNVGNSHDSRAWRCETYTIRTPSGETGTIRCEAEEVTLNVDDREELQKRFDLPLLPDIGIKADEHGRTWALYYPEHALGPLDPALPARVLVNPGSKTEPHPFIDKKFIVGKAFCIWWPPQRLRKIR